MNLAGKLIFGAAALAAGLGGVSVIWSELHTDKDFYQRLMAYTPGGTPCSRS